MRPIRVLHILNGLHAGGMESMIMNYYKNIDKGNIQFDFLVFSPKSFYDKEVERLGGKIFRLTPRRENPIKNYRQLDQFFKNHDEYKIVHIHQGINYFAPLRKARKYNIPFIIAHSHGMDPKLIKKQGVFYNLFTVPTITRLATDFIACSDLAAKQIFGLKIQKEKQYLLLKNAINVEKFKKNRLTRKKVRKMLEIEGKFVIGHVGNFTYPKNHTFIIDVFDRLNNSAENIVLILVGTGPLKEEIKEKVHKLKLEDKVLFLGERKDVNELLQAMDLFIFPSHYEGLPLALIEAQAAGLRTIVSDSITPETKVSDLLEFVSLNKGSNYWAEKIMGNYGENIDIDVDLLQTQIYNSGFDIVEEAKKLEDYYQELYRRN